MQNTRRCTALVKLFKKHKCHTWNTSTINPNLKNGSLYKKCFHTTTAGLAKLFVDNENTYAFRIIESINGSSLLNLDPIPTPITTLEDFEALLNQEWRKRSATEILEAFKSLSGFCTEQNITFSDERFDKLTDGLMDNVEKLTDDELWEFLDVLRLFPVCQSFNSHNFHDIWSALDDVCCWRLLDWPKDKWFDWAEKWYRLNLGKVSDFVYEVVGRSVKRAANLSKNDLVRAFFLCNVCRRYIIDFEYEHALEQKIDEMSLDEIAVVALGYFKTQTKIKVKDICSTMLRKIIDTEEPINDMTLCAILKVVKFSSHQVLDDQIYATLEHLYPTMEKHSNMCIMHMAILGTSLQIVHKPLLKKAAQILANEGHIVEKVRLKDLERILLSLVMFDYNPETTPDIFKVVYDEIHAPQRQKEIAMYPRCLASILNFLSIRNIYSYELIDRLLDKDFIHEVYGKGSKSLPREIFSLDVSIEVDCPDYKGNRLEPAMRYKAVKWLTDYTPKHGQFKKLSKADKVVLEVIDAVAEICNGPDLMVVDHVLPHFSRADVILCKDKSGKFVQPPGFTNYVFGDVKQPFNLDELKWYAVVIVGWNNTINNTSRPVGIINMKCRQLQKLGYKPVLAVWNEFMHLTKDGKIKYILSKLD